MRGRNTVFTVIGLGCIMIAAVTMFILYVQNGRPTGAQAADTQQEQPQGEEVVQFTQETPIPTPGVSEFAVDVGGARVNVQRNNTIAVEVVQNEPQAGGQPEPTSTPIPQPTAVAPTATPDLTVFVTVEAPTATPVPVVVGGNLITAEPEFVTFSYTIVAGDTLYNLAERNNITTELLAVYDIAADHIVAGNIIEIPRPNPVHCSNNRIHLVRPDETVFSISRLYNVTDVQLQSANPSKIDANFNLRSSIVVCIP